LPQTSAGSLDILQAWVRTNSEADHLRRFLIHKNRVESCYRAIDRGDCVKFFYHQGFVAPVSSVAPVPYFAVPKPADGIIDSRQTLRFLKAGRVRRGTHSLPGGGKGYRAFEVAPVQMLYGRVYLTHRCVSYRGLDVVWVAYGALPTEAVIIRNAAISPVPIRP
jgi:hypothetical protein